MYDELSQRTRWAAFFTIKDLNVPSRSTRYYLDCPAEGWDGLVGRKIITSVWIASLEFKSDENVHEDDLKQFAK